jgi:hypothetical protein
MRFSIFILIVSGVMLGCSDLPKKNTKQTSTLVSTLRSVDIDKQPSFTQEKLDQYKISGFSLGSWVNQKPGQYFKLVKPQHENAAVIYLYRPDSNWNRQEIIAPSFFLNDKKIPSLLSNHYYWIELAEGDYKLSISRPLTVLYFQKPLVAHLSVKAGKQYFIKYEEEQFRGGPNGSEDLLRVGPIMQMPTTQALKEIGTTQLKSPGLNYVAEILDDGQMVKSKEKIYSGKYKASDDVRLTRPFKLWNPLTW